MNKTVKQSLFAAWVIVLFCGSLSLGGFEFERGMGAVFALVYSSIAAIAGYFMSK